MNGFLNVLKPPGMSSAGVVGVVRRMLDGEKVGHAGTLDPEAAGVLPIMVGKAARLFDYLVDKEKSYVAEVAFGCATDSQDAQGKVLETGENLPSRASIEQVLPSLIGTITQVPSAYSAIKQNGRPLYEKARKGETVIVPARQVRVDSMTLGPQLKEDGFMLHVDCGRGTYVRTICHDLGKLVGCPAHMRFLLRTKSGVFTLDTAYTLEEIKMAKEEGRLQQLMLTIDHPIRHMPRVDVPKALGFACKNGGKMPVSRFQGLEDIQKDQPFRLYLENQFYGIGEIRQEMVAFRAMIAPEKDLPSA